jgi:hypothetical protein
VPLNLVCHLSLLLALSRIDGSWVNSAGKAVLTVQELAERFGNHRSSEEYHISPGLIILSFEGVAPGNADCLLQSNVPKAIISLFAFTAEGLADKRHANSNRLPPKLTALRRPPLRLR